MVTSTLVFKFYSENAQVPSLPEKTVIVTLSIDKPYI